MKVLTKIIMMALMAGSVQPILANDKSLDDLVKINDTEHGKVQLTYYGNTPEKIYVRIYDEEDKRIFSETIKSKAAITKPYNITRLPYGEYRFEVQVEDEVTIRKIMHEAPQYPGNVKLMTKVFAEDKFKMMVMGPGYKKFKLSIYDDQNELLYQGNISQQENFGRVFNLNGTKANAVKLVLSNENGVVQSKTIDL